ncbi:MAG: hypothetical protein LBM98_06260 [Oscillospiraceae bacterium]|nr:hypothetical protein [Oscillospiraceae bacterium]
MFDAAFKRLMHLSSRAIISFINGLFGLNLPLDGEVFYPNTEQIFDNLSKQYADIIISIRANGREYSFLLEAQSDNDGNMLIRVFSYGYQFALGNKVTVENITTIELPAAIVIYLNPNGNTPKREILRFKFPDGKTVDYVVNSLLLLNYSPEELAARNMELLLPFQLLKLRKQIDGARSHEQRVELVEKLKELIGELFPLIESSETVGKLTPEDVSTISAILEKLNTYLYTAKYQEFKEVNQMVTEIVRDIQYNRMDRVKDEAMNKGRLEERRDLTRSAIIGFKQEKTPDEVIARVFNIPVEQVREIHA